MLWVQRLWLRLQTLLLRRRVAEQLDEEIQFHLDQQTSEYVAAGMDWEEAGYKLASETGQVPSTVTAQALMREEPLRSGSSVLGS
jgi:hypothetical protein